MQLLGTLHIEVYLVVRQQGYLIVGNPECAILIEEMLNVSAIAFVIVQLHAGQRGNGLFVDLLISSQHGLHHQLVFVGHTRTAIVQLTRIRLQLFDGGLHHRGWFQFVGKRAVNMNKAAYLIRFVWAHVTGITSRCHKLPERRGIDGIVHLFYKAVLIPFLFSLEGVAG